MSTDAPTGARVRPPREGRSNGQWLVNGRDPLNHNEEFKAEDNPLNVRARIEQIYAKEGFDSIPVDDLHGRFRWMGLYTQRRQDISGSRTASLGPDELSDKYFMLRVRIDGGAVSTDQLRVIAGISKEFGRDTADISDRQNVQLHWIRVEDMPEIWQRLDAVGLQTTEACGDCPRVVLGSPLAGESLDEVLDPATRILSVGFSQGGLMATQLLRTRPERIAATVVQIAVALSSGHVHHRAVKPVRDQRLRGLGTEVAQEHHQGIAARALYFVHEIGRAHV